MRICGRCRKEVTQEATSCPHCGARFKPKTMTPPPPPPTYQQQPSMYQQHRQQPPMYQQGYPQAVSSEKSFVALLLLCIFLGGFGAHRFYAGKIGSAVAILLMSTLGVCLVIPVIAAGIWAFVDLILIICGKFTDENGMPIKSN